MVEEELSRCGGRCESEAVTDISVIEIYFDHGYITCYDGVIGSVNAISIYGWGICWTEYLSDISPSNNLVGPLHCA